MNSWQQHLYYSADRIRAWRGYARAKLGLLQDARLSRRVIVKEVCRIDRPSGVAIGERSPLAPRVAKVSIYAGSRW